MLKIASILFIILFVGLECSSQDLRIINLSNQADISGATIVIQSQDNHGWVGYESLDLLIKVVNAGNSTLEIGAKKVEHDSLQTDVQHLFCFAGLCYPPSVFVSPNHVVLPSGSSDSSFIVHYMFDNTVHVRGSDHVSYVFYDVNNPDDSVVVHVTYNTVVAGIEVPENKFIKMLSFPNPANSEVTFQLDHISSISSTTHLDIMNAIGEQLRSLELFPNENQVSFRTADLPSGIYSYTLFEANNRIANGKIIVIH